VPEKSAELPGESAELLARFAILPTPSAEELSLAAE
jgi:hypothetical protein